MAYIIFKLVKEKLGEKRAQIAALVFLFNPAIWYNSIIWGQYDSVNNFFALLSFYYLLKRNLTGSTISFLISIYIKLSLIIFAPILLVVAIGQKYSFQTYNKSLVFTLIAFLLIFAPFSQGNVFLWVYELYANRVSVVQLQLITANAFNLWAGIAGIHRMSHDILLGPLSYKLWGAILFTISSIPPAVLLIKDRGVESVFWALSIVTLSSFMLLTNMHERYLYPFFVVFLVVAIRNRRVMVYYVLFSLINILNLYNFWWIPRITILINFLSFSDRLVPRILGIAGTILFVYIYRDFSF